ncbi:NAD(P)/FAD-dependent oxidoreductase [Shouchella shacheensis]|uniref:NAD(P)/FAD-dependent oxidoreductase n=1 Tax=Shouchella shacheensis TaxID=1649580 RepID=UPI0007404176|nr:NAD(P)/FAD-dependent oxidoreductase [Shouchella shacheensis]
MVSKTKLVIVGAGPAGLGVGILLKKLGFDAFKIVEREEIGASFLRWPKEMKLITPSFTGQGFGALDLNAIAPNTSPAYSMHREHLTGEEYKEYLELLVAHFDLPIQENWEVNNVRKEGKQFYVEGESGTIEANAVIWASGEYAFAKKDAFPGANLALHNSEVRSWTELPKDHHYVIGGFESAMDAAIQLVRCGSDVTVLMTDELSELGQADPSLRLSPYTSERLEWAMNTGRVKLQPNSRVTKLEWKGRKRWRIHLIGDRLIESLSQPVLANGFHSGARQISSLFEWQTNGKPLLTKEADESTLTKNLFLTGANVQHENAVFCFIYKFRQRFAVIVRQLFERWGLPIDNEVLSDYRDNQMLMEDLSCCEVLCEC